MLTQDLDPQSAEEDGEQVCPDKHLHLVIWQMVLSHYRSAGTQLSIMQLLVNLLSPLSHLTAFFFAFYTTS